jgi:hypothetical protein
MRGLSLNFIPGEVGHYFVSIDIEDGVFKRHHGFEVKQAPVILGFQSSSMCLSSDQVYPTYFEDTWMVGWRSLRMWTMDGLPF